MKLTKKQIAVAAYVYMLLPIFCFLFTWLKLIIALPAIGLLVYGAWVIFKKDYYAQDAIYIKVGNFFLIVLLTCLCCWLAGQGGWFFQTKDNHVRNAILRDLITHSWPVIYQADESALVYYLATWIIPAVVGKFFGWTAANITLFLWDALGILLAVMVVIACLDIRSGKVQVSLVLLFMGWGGIHIVAEGIGSAFFGAAFPGLSSGNGWSGMLIPNGFQFPSGFALIQWVYNQAIVPIIAVPLLALAPRLEVFMFLAFCVLPYAPLPFAGLAMIMVSMGISQLVQHIKQKDIKTFFGTVFSVPNLTAMTTLFPIYALYYSCNSSATGANGRGGVGWYVPLQDFTAKRVLVYVLFIFFEYGLYALLVGKRFKKDPLFWGTVISLFLIPFFRIGTSNDFGMRACIPGLYMMMLFVLRYLLENQKFTFKTVSLLMCIAFMMWNFYGALCQSIIEVRKAGTIFLPADDIGSLENYALGLMEDKLDTLPDMTVNFCCFDPFEKPFYKYVADLHGWAHYFLPTN